MSVFRRIFAAASLCVLLFACGDDDHTPSFSLKVLSYAGGELTLAWDPVRDAGDYQIWRSSSINGTAQDPVRIGTVDWLTLAYTDKSVPIQSELNYYVTTTVDGKEIKSNVVTEKGGQWFNILPYQVKLLPEKNLAVIRGYSEVVLVDYAQKAIVTRKEFPGKVGTIDIATVNGKKELYVASSDHNVYICDPYDLKVKETLSTGYAVGSVAVNTQGMIFVSNYDPATSLKIYDRSTLNLTNQYRAESGSVMILQSDYKLFTISSHTFPATISYYTFSPQGDILTKVDDDYAWDYEKDAGQFRVSDKYIVTSTEGFIYTADEKMTPVTNLKNFSNDQSDFEFGADGTTIYAAVTNERYLLKANIAYGTPSVTKIATTGYPWVMARNGDEMIVVSSPDSFILSSITNKSLIERVPLK